MTIKIFPSLMPGEPIEVHQWAGTLGVWLKFKGIEYNIAEEQPIAVFLNGAPLPVEKWETISLSHDDAVEIRVIPTGFYAIAAIIIALVVSTVLLSKGMGANYNSASSGAQLDPSQAQANQVKLGDAVPESSGRAKRFPDYLTPPRRYFVDKRAQWLEFHCCIGPGEYQIDPDGVKVGDTSFSSLGADAEYQIFSPGADLSGVSTHEHWLNVDEVGGTSSGTAGLELSTEIANRTNAQPSSYIFNGGEVNRSDGVFPPGWGSGTTVNVQYPRPYKVATVTVNPSTGNSYAVSEITGWFAHVPISVGAQISLGAIGESVLYTIEYVSFGIGGVATIRLTTISETPAHVVFPPGDSVIMMFGSSVERTLATLSEQAFSLAGTLSFESISLANSVVKFSGGTVYGEWTSEFQACPGNETTTLLEVDFFFPGGLVYLDDGGGLQGRSVGMEIQYRDPLGLTPRVTVQRVYTDSTLDQIGFTERITIPEMQPLVRCRRIGASSTSTQAKDTIHWYGLKSRLRTRTAYPNWTTMSVRLRSGGRLASQSENQISVIPVRILPTLLSDGTWGNPIPTRDISAFVRYITHSIGYTDADLDMADLTRLHALWSARGDTFDYAFDLTTVKDALNTALSAGMAELTIADGKIRPVRDDARSLFEQSYSPQNMTGSLNRSFTAKRLDDPDGVEVEYRDENTWTQETVICSLPGSQRLKLEKITLDGVVDRTRAWRIGMRRVRETKYRRWEYSFGTEMDAFNSEYGSYIALFDDVPGYGQSALLNDISATEGGAQLVLSEPMKWEEGSNHIVGYRRPDGTLAGPWPAKPGDDDYTLIAPIPQPWVEISLKQELPHVYFGAEERWTFPALVREITANGMESASVKAVNYDPRIYEDDDNEPDE